MCCSEFSNVFWQCFVFIVFCEKTINTVFSIALLLFAQLFQVFSDRYSIARRSRKPCSPVASCQHKQQQLYIYIYIYISLFCLVLFLRFSTCFPQLCACFIVFCKKTIKTVFSKILMISNGFLPLRSSATPLFWLSAGRSLEASPCCFGIMA